MPKRLSKTRVQKMIEAYKAGQPVSALRKRFKISQATAYKWLKTQGATSGKKQKKENTKKSYPKPDQEVTKHDWRVVSELLVSKKFTDRQRLRMIGAYLDAR